MPTNASALAFAESLVNGNFSTAAQARTLITGVRLARDAKEKKIADELLANRPNAGGTQVRYTGPASYKETRRGLLAYKNNPQSIYLFQFNPEDIDDTKENTYSDDPRPSRQYVEQIWGGGGPRSLSFSLFLDATAGTNSPEFTSTALGNPGYDSLPTTSPNGIMDEVQFLKSFLYPQLENPNAARFIYGGAVEARQFAAPPTAVFVYGNFYFEGIIRRADARYNLWDKDLIPRRGTVDVTIEVFEEQVVNPNQDLRRAHTRP